MCPSVLDCLLLAKYISIGYLSISGGGAHHGVRRNTFALAVALAVKSCNNKIIYQDIFIALADADNDLSMPCHKQRTGAATVFYVRGLG